VHKEETKRGVNVKSRELDLRKEEIKWELRHRGHVQKGDK
jgi:hypothetical protein